MKETAIPNVSLVMQATQTSVELAQPQIVRWGPSDGLPAGIWLNRADGSFIPWTELKEELEQKLLNQLGQRIPPGCTVTIQDYFGRKDWVMRIQDPSGNEVGSMWLGNDPMNEWRFDGMVRAGKTLSDREWEVWQTFQRFSDGSYRRV
jgi:hypothetical protein